MVHDGLFGLVAGTNAKRDARADRCSVESVARDNRFAVDVVVAEQQDVLSIKTSCGRIGDPWNWCRLRDLSGNVYVDNNSLLAFTVHCQECVPLVARH